MRPAPTPETGTAEVWSGRCEGPTNEIRRNFMRNACSHLNQIRVTTTDVDVCEDCVKIGDTWVHLRLCMKCGHVGCCDSSKNKHATKHFHRTKHPLVRSIEPAETWPCFSIAKTIHELTAP